MEKIAKEKSKANFGKWSHPGVPHKGWSCVHYEYLEDDTRYCDMCEQQEIRHAYTMKHDEFAETLVVGIHCMERMIQDYKNSNELKRAVTKLFKIGKNWETMKWRNTRTGQSTKILQYLVCIVASKEFYYIRIKEGKNWTRGQMNYSDTISAKKAAKKALTWMILKSVRDSKSPTKPADV